MIPFIGMLAAMVSMALATCSLVLAVVVYRRIRGSSTSRQERQETAQTAPAAVPAAVVAAGGGADGFLGWPIIARWFGLPAVSLDVLYVHLLIESWSRTVGERLLSSRVAVGCWPRAGQCRGSLLVMRRLVRLLPLVAAWVDWCLAPCRVVGRGPPARNARLLSLIAAAITPINQKTGG